MGQGLASADGYQVVLVEAQPGYNGNPHLHEHAVFLFVIQGSLRNQSQHLQSGGSHAAAAGSTPDDSGTETGATSLSIFKL